MQTNNNFKLAEEELLKNIAEIHKKCIGDFNSYSNMALKNELNNVIKSNNCDNKTKCTAIQEFLNNRISICEKATIYKRIEYITELVADYGDEKLQDYWYNELNKIKSNDGQQLIKEHLDKLKNKQLENKKLENRRLKNNKLSTYNIHDEQLRNQLHIESTIINRI